MTQQDYRHSITPPPELVRQWMEHTEYDEHTWFYESYIAEQAAQWGADQELVACCHYFARDLRESLALELRAARRPEPQEAMIPDQYKGHQVHVYRAGFHAGYTHGLTRANAALAQPEPEGPTDEELRQLWRELERPSANQIPRRTYLR